MAPLEPKIAKIEPLSSPKSRVDSSYESARPAAHLEVVFFPLKPTQETQQSLWPKEEDFAMSFNDDQSALLSGTSHYT